MCGEHDGAAVPSGDGPGSSPRVRGTRRRCGLAGAWLRIIPACAGNTATFGGSYRKPTDHPRVCGEHGQKVGHFRQQVGSSPRVRGTHVILSKGFEQIRIIPACAGNTHSRASCQAKHADHPRVCGEHGYGHDSSLDKAGSSPRVRGTRMGSLPRLAQPRIIPACAGNTPSSAAIAVLITDHPRVCGEHIYTFENRDRGFGSSPRVRGTPAPKMR